MKQIPCSYKNCSERRIHHERQDISRGLQLIDVSEEFNGKAYCSIMCASLDQYENPIVCNKIIRKEEIE